MFYFLFLLLFVVLMVCLCMYYGIYSMNYFHLKKVNNFRGRSTCAHFFCQGTTTYGKATEDLNITNLLFCLYCILSLSEQKQGVSIGIRFCFILLFRCMRFFFRLHLISK